MTYDDSRRVVDMTEILPNLFVGDEGAAKNAFYLKKIKVTHVLNAAQVLLKLYVHCTYNSPIYDA